MCLLQLSGYEAGGVVYTVHESSLRSKINMNAAPQIADTRGNVGNSAIETWWKTTSEMLLGFPNWMPLLLNQMASADL